MLRGLIPNPISRFRGAGDLVRHRRSSGCLEDLAACDAEDRVETIDDLAAWIANEGTGSVQTVTVTQEQVPCRLGCSQPGRVWGDAGEKTSLVTSMKKRRKPAAQEQGVDSGEVEPARGLGAQE